MRFELEAWAVGMGTDYSETFSIKIKFSTRKNNQRSVPDYYISFPLFKVPLLTLIQKCKPGFLENPIYICDRMKRGRGLGDKIKEQVGEEIGDKAREVLEDLFK